MIEKIGRTLEELYYTYIKDFDKFLQLTEGTVYCQDSTGQIGLVFIETVDDLSQYFDCTVIRLEEDNQKLQIVIKE